DVHDLEPSPRDLQGARQGDHPRGQVDADHLSARHHHRRHSPAQGARAAREIEDFHPRPRIDQLESAPAAQRLAAGHDLLQPLLVGDSVTAENRGEQILGLHASSVFPLCSSQAAALRASLLVLPTTWIPTGNPRTGAGRQTTGWPEVLNGRVYRVTGSRTSVPTPMVGATTALAGSTSASTPCMARIAASRGKGKATIDSSKSMPRTTRPRRRFSSTSAPYFSGHSASHRRWYTALSTSR